MTSLLRRLLLVSACLAPAAPALAQPTLADALVAAAPTANPDVIRYALQAVSCAVAHGEPSAQRLAVIDYSVASVEPRLWVFDLAQASLLHTELVAHGRNSGENYARTFSNKTGSYTSSLGLFRTMDAYEGRNGYSLRMAGLERDFNDRALERAIVMHGAPYVDPKVAKTLGRLGRSWGCPAVRPEVAQLLIDTLKGGQYVFSYYPDPKWLASSPLLNCNVAAAKGMRQPARATKAAFKQ
jgi:hypothetical protein